MLTGGSEFKAEAIVLGACPRVGLWPSPGELPRTLEALNPLLDSFQHLYKHHWPRVTLDGLTPAVHLAKFQDNKTPPSHIS